MEMFQLSVVLISYFIKKEGGGLKKEWLRVTVDRVEPGYRGGRNASHQQTKFQSVYSKHHLHSKDY